MAGPITAPSRISLSRGRAAWVVRGRCQLSRSSQQDGGSLAGLASCVDRGGLDGRTRVVFARPEGGIFEPCAGTKRTIVAAERRQFGPAGPLRRQRRARRPGRVAIARPEGGLFESCTGGAQAHARQRDSDFAGTGKKALRAANC